MKTERLAFEPTPQSRELLAQSVKGLKPDDCNLIDWHEKYCRNQAHRLALDLDLIRERVPINARVLEAGSVPLLLTTALASVGYQVEGCDLEPERYANAIAALNIRIARCDIEQEHLPFPDNGFDAVLFNELFEHLRLNPIFTLTEVLRVLKPGGTLFLSSPNLRSLGGLKNFLLHNKAYSNSGNVYAEYQKLQELGHMGHVREYTTTEVTEFLRSIGFEITGLIFRGRYEGTLAKTIIRVMPSMSPFVSYLATKPISG